MQKDLTDKDVWGFEWDDIEEAVKETEQEMFGPETSRGNGERLCFQCGEINEIAQEGWLHTCEYCGADYQEARVAKIEMASVIDVAWPSIGDTERESFRRMQKRLRLISPEYREMWRKNANRAALLRRYAHG